MISALEPPGGYSTDPRHDRWLQIWPVRSKRAEVWDTDGVVGEGRNEIRWFAEELRQRLLRGRYRHVKAFADRPELTGVGRSTAYDALAGRRLPTEATLASLLRAVVQSTDDEIASWLEKRADVVELLAQAEKEAEPAVADSDVASDDRPTPAPPGRVVRGPAWTWLIVAALVGVVVGVGSTVLVQHLGQRSATQVASPPCGISADLRTHSVSARIAHTQGEGVYTFGAANIVCRAGFAPDQADISVVCQVLAGYLMTDTLQGAIRQGPVWDKLSSGAYVPDLYTDLPKSTKPALVSGLPAC